MSARAVAKAGVSVLSVFGVPTGSAAENGTFHSEEPGSFRQSRSKSSAPRLSVFAVRSQAASTPQASRTSTTPPSLPVAVPPGSAAHAFAASAAARPPAVTRLANCCA